MIWLISWIVLGLIGSLTVYVSTNYLRVRGATLSSLIWRVRIELHLRDALVILFLGVICGYIIFLFSLPHYKEIFGKGE